MENFASAAALLKTIFLVPKLCQLIFYCGKETEKAREGVEKGRGKETRRPHAPG